jgi:P-type Ca2+ transporter type 2C
VTTTSTGLTALEVRDGLVRWGENRLVRVERFARIRDALRTLADPMAVMLVASAAVYLALGQSRDAYVLLAALVPVLGVDVLLEARSHAALQKLGGQVAHRARVVRDGREVDIPTEYIVPGDLLLLTEGEVAHADGVVRTASHLSMDESLLTGESEPQSKQPCSSAVPSSDEARFWAGSLVLAGNGRGEVTATGSRTRFGEAAMLVAAVRDQSTPLQARVGRIFRSLGFVAVGLALFVGGVALFRGEGWGRATLSAVSLAMAAIPEEFPLVLTIFLSLGALRLTRHGVLVRRLASVETLGSTTVLCVDKTGTLTFGKFALEAHEPLGPNVSESALLEAAALACEIRAEDPLDKAIVTHCAEHGVDVESLHRNWTLAYDHDFDPAGRHMSHVWNRRGGGGARIVAKGALEGVLEHCSATEAERLAANTLQQRLADQGMRVLAVAGRDDTQAPLDGRRDLDEQGLKLLGLLGFRDPIRPEVPDAIAGLQNAGVLVKMITGDHAFTAHAVAQATGIRDAERLVTGRDFAALGKTQREQCARVSSVFARFMPAEKHDLVVALQGAGETVAMTGDGINDAPALRRADIGVSMGERATAVARAAADLVLLKDDLTALLATLAEGRRIYANVRRSFLYLLAFHVPIIVLAIAVPLLGFPLLLQPIHLVWLELIVHPVSALVFEEEPGTPDQMRRPPRRRDEALVPIRLALPSLLSGFVIAVGALALYAARLPLDGEPAARGAALVAVVLGSVLLIWTERSAEGRTPFPRGKRFWIVSSAVLASIPLCIYVPTIAAPLHVVPPSTAALGLGVLAAVAAVLWRPLIRKARTGRD